MLESRLLWLLETCRLRLLDINLWCLLLLRLLEASRLGLLEAWVLLLLLSILLLRLLLAREACRLWLQSSSGISSILLLQWRLTESRLLLLRAILRLLLETLLLAVLRLLAGAVGAAKIGRRTRKHCRDAGLCEMIIHGGVVQEIDALRGKEP